MQWGPVADIGLAAAEDLRGGRLAERGVGAVAVDQAWEVLDALLDSGHEVAAFAPLDPRRWFDAHPDSAAQGSWRRMRALAQRDAGGSAGQARFLAELLAAEPAERLGAARAKVRELAGRVLRLDPEGIDADRPFKALGLDSLMSLELRNRLEGAFGLRLSPTLLWAFGTTEALAAELCARAADAAAGPAA